MGTGGPGNIVHIDNLYVKTNPVKSNISILLGDFCIFDTDGLRPIVAGDFVGDDTFLNIKTTPVFQAAEDADNLTTTNVNLRKTEIEVITRGSDLVASMRAGVLPDQDVGILRVDAATPVFQVAEQSVAATPVAANEVLGVYKHKEFSTIALISVQSDNGIVSTGLGVA